MKPITAIVVLLSAAAAAPAGGPRTVAEASGYTRTSTHAEVLTYCRELAKSPAVALGALGKSHLGKTLPTLTLGQRKPGRPAVLVIANIHSGECAGKEGLLRLCRELAAGPDPLLEKLTLVAVPIFSADANDRMAAGNRPGQVGPRVMGERPNAQGLDLNRDFVKLESPEVRALVRLMNELDPVMFIDLHTTNGSRHRYTLTYDGPRNPAGDGRIIEYARETLLPDAGRRVEESAGYKLFHYGNFTTGNASWRTYPALPRYGVQYFGLRNRLGVLSEAYSYASYRDRILASRAFVRACLGHVAANAGRIKKLLADADGPADVPVAHRPAAFKQPYRVLGSEGEHRIPFYGREEPTATAGRPAGYLIDPRCAAAAANLRRHGFVVKKLTEPLSARVVPYAVKKVERAARPYQKHKLVRVKAEKRPAGRRTVPAGWFVVRPTGRLANLAVYLLEPASRDGLAAWNFLDAALAEGREYPVLRVVRIGPADGR